MHARAETSCALNSASSLVAGAWGPDDGGRRPLLFMEPIARCWASGLSRQHHHPHPSVSCPAFLYHPSFSLSSPPLSHQTPSELAPRRGFLTPLPLLTPPPFSRFQPPSPRAPLPKSFLFVSCLSPLYNGVATSSLSGRTILFPVWKPSWSFIIANSETSKL